MRDVITRPRPFDPDHDPPAARCCPLCRQPMARVVLAAIPLDRCDADACLWFDRDELSQLLARTREQHDQTRGLLRRILYAIRW